MWTKMDDRPGTGKADDRPILVTGAHRSGTTWVGTSLGKSRHVCYMHEPFNFCGPGIYRLPVSYHFPTSTAGMKVDISSRSLSCSIFVFFFGRKSDLRARSVKSRQRSKMPCFSNGASFKESGRFLKILSPSSLRSVWSIGSDSRWS
jgi:hypothetical protein